MINKSKGMIWYRILQGLLIFWMITGALAVIGLVISPSIPDAPGFYNFVSSLYSLIFTIMLYMLYDNMRNYRISALDSIKNILWFQGLTCSFLFLMSLIAQDYTVMATVLGSALATTIIFLPTYFYLRNRLTPDQTPAYPTTVKFDPLSIIPAKLLYITDQAERDRIIADTLRGNTNPYTGFFITNEKEWNEFAAAETAARQVVSKPQAPTTTIDDPPKPQAMFCRSCGNALRKDSNFCEYCGLSKE